MVSFCDIVVLTTVALVQLSSGQLSNDKGTLLNWCLRSRSHKQSPGKEDSLHQQCSPWRDHACCTEEVSQNIHSLDMYNFTLDHCASQTGQPMSQQCRRHFTQDNCFYECEPHAGLWVVETNRTIASERFYNVPLCANDCEEWFEDCKNDFTCAYNWPRDFKFSSGKNTCRDGMRCQKFKDIYNNSAKEFCENVWDHSWRYTAADHPCMHMWFDGNAPNPNEKVAEYYIDLRFHGSSAAAVQFSWAALLLAAAVLGWS